MNRRLFIQNSILSTASMKLLEPIAKASVPTVALHGADSTGAKDSTRAFCDALARLPQEHGKFVIPTGVYSFKEASGVLFELSGHSDLVIDGNGSLFQFEGNTRPFNFKNSTDIVLRNLAIDWPRPPFSQAEVMAVGPRWMRVKVDKEFPVTGEEPIEAIGEYDRSLGMMSVNGLDLYGQVRSVRLVAPQELRIEFDQPITIQIGSTVVLRHHVYGVNIMSFVDCKNVSIEGVTLNAAPGMGLAADHCENLRLHRLSVQPRNGTNRLLSLNADATHFTECAGNIEITDCSFRGMGDDAINICSSYLSIVRVIDPRTWVVRSRNNDSFGSWRLPANGTLLDVCDQRSLKLIGTALVTNASTRSGESVVRVDHDLPVSEGMLVCGAQAKTKTVIANCTFGPNRARAIVAHNNISILNNSFYGQSLAAILLSPDTTWMEGPVVSNAEISGNSFDFNYYARTESRRGAITVDRGHDVVPSEATPERINHDVIIYNNVFSRSHGEAIYVNLTTDVVIFRNEITNSSILRKAGTPAEAVVLKNTLCSLLKRNHLDGNEEIVMGDN